MNLSPSQILNLRDRIAGAYSLDEFDELIRHVRNRTLDDYAAPGLARRRIREAIDAANRQGWLAELIEAIRKNPHNRNSALLEAVSTLGVVSLVAPEMPPPAPGETTDSALERMVRSNSGFVAIGQFLDGLAQIERAVCRVDYPQPGEGQATGFLVARDLVLTNYHVVAPVLSGSVTPEQVTCRFDYRRSEDGTFTHQGTPVALARKWHVGSSPPSPTDEQVDGGDPSPQELDYALVRLAEPVGSLPFMGDTDPEAPKRGWIRIPETPPVPADGTDMLVLQHPSATPLALAWGRVLGFFGQRRRIRHDANTKGGSSGSVCLTYDLVPFALHHAGDPNFDPAHRPQYNQAIPLGLIVEHAKAQSLPGFWVES